jgi:hypothetical protein
VYDLFKKLSDTQEDLASAADTRFGELNTRFSELNTRMQVFEGVRASADNTREHQYCGRNGLHATSP